MRFATYGFAVEVDDDQIIVVQRGDEFGDHSVCFTIHEIQLLISALQEAEKSYYGDPA